MEDPDEDSLNFQQFAGEQLRSTKVDRRRGVPYDLELPRINLLARQFRSWPFAEEYPHRWSTS